MSRKPQLPPGWRTAPLPEGFPGRVDFVKSAARLAQAPHTPLPEVCVCGRSNVGKSSLLNTLTGRRQLARVSSTPGRTQLINFFNVQDRLSLVDLPGYGWAKVRREQQSEWGRTIQGYLADRPQLVLALLLLDIRREPEDEERELLAWFLAQGRKCLLVATKADKLSPSRQPGRLAAVARSLGVHTAAVVPFSATTRLGREVLWSLILGQTSSAGATPSAPEGEAVADDPLNP